MFEIGRKWTEPFLCKHGAQHLAAEIPLLFSGSAQINVAPLWD